MKPTARFGDRCFGTCYGHTTPISVGGTIITGPTNVLTNGKPTARLGDSVSGVYVATIITGSGDVLTG